LPPPSIGSTMSPDRPQRPRASPRFRTAVPVQTTSSSRDAYDIVFFRRHSQDDPIARSPARDALNGYPPRVRAQLRAVLVAVAAAPPDRFAGGGNWEAMEGKMAGWFEARAEGNDRHHYRLYCRLDGGPADGSSSRPLLVVIAALDTPYKRPLSVDDYVSLEELGREYLSRLPRSVF